LDAEACSTFNAGSHADELICDFFAAVEQACKQEGVPFEFDTDEVELEAEEDDDGTQITE
jgi:hypothetical protein